MNGRSAEAQLLVDGADNSTVGPVAAYVQSIQAMAAERIAALTPGALRTAHAILVQPGAEQPLVRDPGPGGRDHGILSIVLTSLTVAREWEKRLHGTAFIDAGASSEIIVGRSPYAVLGSSRRSLFTSSPGRPSVFLYWEPGPPRAGMRAVPQHFIWRRGS